MQQGETGLKKSLIVLALIIFLIGLTLVVPAKTVGLKTKNKPLVLKTKEELALLSGDVDRNGVPDWKDLALENSKELRASTTLVIDPSTTRQLKDPNNLTASFSKNAYIASAFAEKNGLSEKQTGELVGDLITSEAKKIVFKEYTYADLRIAQNNSDEVKRAYGNALGVVLKKAIDLKVNESDMPLLMEYQKTEDVALLKSLETKHKNLDNITVDLLKIQVPKTAAPYHLLLVNKVSEYSTLLENVAKMGDDPVRGMLAFNTQKATMTTLFSVLGSLEKYFINNKITFTKNEPGYILNGKVN